MTKVRRSVGAARSLAPVAIIDMVEDIVSQDRVTDTVTFNQLVAQRNLPRWRQLYSARYQLSDHRRS